MNEWSFTNPSIPQSDTHEMIIRVENQVAICAALSRISRLAVVCCIGREFMRTAPCAATRSPPSSGAARVDLQGHG